MSHYAAWNQQGDTTDEPMSVATAERIAALWERGGPSRMKEPLTHDEVMWLHSHGSLTKECHPIHKKP